MKINKIKKMKSGKYKIEFDDENNLITYDDVILKNNLMFTREIDSNVLNQLNIDTKYFDIYHKCLNYISRRLRSEKEMYIYLSKFLLEDDIINRIINDLKKIKLINDDLFIKAYVSDRVHLSNDGLNKIRQDLINHDIDEHKINDEISKVDIELIKDKLNKLILKRKKLKHKYSNFILKQKIYNEMVNLGYDSDMINEMLSYNDSDDHANLVREFDKLFNKLSVKDDKGLLKIKRKLYQKGFSAKEIDNLINEKVQID